METNSNSNPNSKDAYFLFKNRFSTNVLILDNECHIWIGSKCGNGYGYVTVRKNNIKKNFLLHRVVYENELNINIKNLVVMHKCDNPSCCNVKHLIHGSMSDNTRDMVLKNRHPPHMRKSENNPNKKINKEQLNEIINSKLSSRVLAKIYNVHFSTILRLIKNKGY